MKPPAYILAGGRSRRFGSDKARAMHEGQAMIIRVARLAQPAASAVYAVADRAGRYDDLGLTTLADHHPGRGPLAGLEAALRHRLDQHGSGWIILLSCDLLHLEPDWLSILEQATHDTPDALAAAFREHDRWQPLLSLYHTDALPLVQQRLADDHLAMQHLLNDPAMHTATAPLPPDWPATLQANRREDLR